MIRIRLTIVSVHMGRQEGYIYSPMIGNDIKLSGMGQPPQKLKNAALVLAWGNSDSNWTRAETTFYINSKIKCRF